MGKQSTFPTIFEIGQCHMGSPQSLTQNRWICSSGVLQGDNQMVSQYQQYDVTDARPDGMEHTRRQLAPELTLTEPLQLLVLHQKHKTVEQARFLHCVSVNDWSEEVWTGQGVYKINP